MSEVNFTADECIEELNRFSEEYPDKRITRNFFRGNSNVPEKAWTEHFGTWVEFKKQAGMSPTRQQSAIANQAAKHASVDHYREFGNERLDWGEKFVRENNRRFKTILSASDLHDIECDPFWLSVFIDTAKRVQPDIIVLDGDVFDLPEFGRYFVDPRTWDVTGRIKFVHDNILKPLREACPEAQIDMIEGNHEYRLLRHLADATPALQSLLADLHGFTVSKLLGLDEFEINYIAKADLAAYNKGDIKKEIGKNYRVYYDCFIAHHFPEGRNLGLPGVSGHHHKQVMWALHNETYGSYNWLQMAAGHHRDAEYCNGEIWQLGFALNHIDTHEKLVNIEPVIITDFACVGGKYYHRED